VQTLCELLQFKDQNVREYVFGLLGEIQKHQLSDMFKLQLPQLILMAIDNITFADQQSSFVQNNACWFLGELASVHNNREIIKPFLNQIAGKLSMLYQYQTLNKSLAINVAITFGRLGLVDAREVSLGYLDAIAK
jgi:hypothetical protein